MAEVYAQALLRDVPFEYFDDKVTPPQEALEIIEPVLKALNKLHQSSDGFNKRILSFPSPEEAESKAKDKEAYLMQEISTMQQVQYYPHEIGASKDKSSVGTRSGEEAAKIAFTRGNLFRGFTFGDHAGPYLSQFLLGW